MTPIVGGRALRGDIVYHPHIRGPNGDVGVFRFHFQPGASPPFELVAQAHEALAVNMPFLRNNLLYYPMLAATVRYKAEKAQYDASRVPVLLAEDLYANSVFHAVNAGVGFGLLRVLGPGERPSFRDIAILRTLPNDLPTFAGAISLVPQTPLSHVNLRAVQNGVPNAYIGNALEDATISALVGKYVRFEVKASSGDGGLRATYTIREATAEEVEAHHADRRPTEAQTPTRDLTVTAYEDLDDIAFADSDAFGVKAANVAAMRDFGFAAGTVPDGYALPFYFYDEFMKHNSFYAAVDALLADTDFQEDVSARTAALKKLRRRIENGTVPDWMADGLAELQAEFPDGTSIRCRSSTNNEDLPGFSGAGLYDSYTHHPTEGHLSKSIKQVYASLWNLRAFEERDFHRIDHKAAAMGVLLHPNYSGEQANGVAVTDDPFYGTEDRFYVNAQVGEELVTNPSGAVVPEELLLGTGEQFATALVQRSNLVADDARVLSEAHIATLQAALRTIHSRFRTLYDIAEDEEFAMEIEFKITAAGTFAVKQRSAMGVLKGGGWAGRLKRGRCGGRPAVGGGWCFAGQRPGSDAAELGARECERGHAHAHLRRGSGAAQGPDLVALRAVHRPPPQRRRVPEPGFRRRQNRDAHAGGGDRAERDDHTELRSSVCRRPVARYRRQRGGALPFLSREQRCRSAPMAVLAVGRVAHGDGSDSAACRVHRRLHVRHAG